MKKKEYKIFEAMHDKQRCFLVFSPDNQVVYKTSKRENADNFIQTAQRAKGNN